MSDTKPEQDVVEDHAVETPEQEALDEVSSSATHTQLFVAMYAG